MQMHMATAQRVQLAVVAASTVWLAQSLVRGYRAWLAVGRAGGVPPNPRGYAMHLLIRAASILQPSLRSSAPYAKLMSRYGPVGEKSYLAGTVARRDGGDAATLPWTVPHRQVQGNGAEMRKASTGVIIYRVLQASILTGLADEHSSQLEIKTSRLEKHGQALFLRQDIPHAEWQRGMLQGEIAHFHLVAEGSGHAVLSIKDAQTVLEQGWGERHALSGLAIPWGYVMVFAPRNEAEVQTVRLIMEAAARFALAAAAAAEAAAEAAAAV